MRGEGLRSRAAASGMIAARLICLGLGLLGAGAAVQAADAYPARAVRLVIPFPPSGSNDIVGRFVAQHLSDRLGKQVVADNRAGANSIIGTELVAKSPPDGHTLLVISTSFTTNPAVYKQLPYDPLKAFAWVAMLGSGPNAMAVTAALPAKSVKEFIALARARPGQMLYASSGIGGFQHFGTELFSMLAKVKMTHVPYKGGGPAMVDVISGQAQVTMGSLIQVVPHVQTGRLRVLGTGGAKRAAKLPDVPTIAEAGVPGYECVNWWGIVAPAGTPADVIRRLNTEIAAILSLPDAQKRMVAEGADPAIMTPEQLGRHVQSEMAKWAKVAKAADIRADQ